MIERVAKYKQIKRVLLVTLIGNLLVALFKLVVGYTTATLAMVADGYHSLFDASNNVVGFVAIYFAYKPADADHQYGHRKYETVSAMAISVMLFAAAYTILADAVARLRQPVEPDVGVVNFAVMIGTLLVNLAVSTWERRRGRELKSALLISDAEHTRSDIFATLTVIFSLVATRLGFPILDVLASLVIAAIIVRVGYRIVRSGLGVISDMAVIDPEEVVAGLDCMEGIEGCTSVRTRGPEDHVFMDLTILVAPEMPLIQAHNLADQVEDSIRQRYPGVVDIVIHMEPRPEEP